MRKPFLHWFMLILLGASPPGWSADPLVPAAGAANPFNNRSVLTSPLPADEAFMLEVIPQADSLLLRWTIAEGYYLYRKSLTFTEDSKPGVLGQAEIPAGEIIDDEFFGEVAAYYREALVRLPLLNTGAGSIEFSATYQGCAEIGYCYPPQERRITLDLP